MNIDWENRNDMIIFWLNISVGVTGLLGIASWN
jgi:hypothetical protein